MKELSLRVDVTQAEFLRALKLYGRSTWRRRLVSGLFLGYTILAVVVSLVIAGIVYAKSPTHAGFFVLLAGLTVLPYYFRGFAQPRQAYRVYMRLQPEARYRLGERGVEVETPKQKSLIGWEAIDQVQDDKALVLLSTKTGMHLILPKRCFPDAESIAGFLTLAAARAGAPTP